MVIKVYTRKGNSEDILSLVFDNTTATAADYLKFIKDIIDLLQEDKQALEKEANASNKTMKHDLFLSVGTIPMND